VLPTAALACAALAATPVLHVVAVDARGAPGRTVFLREGEPATLALLVEDGERCWATEPVDHRGVRCAALDPGSLRSARWFVARPEPREYDNSAACGRRAPDEACRPRIAYDARELAGVAGHDRVETLAEAELSALGTHRVGAALSFGGVALASSPGLGPGPITEANAQALLQVVVRRDDTYVGYLTEQLGTPFVYAPARLPAGRHQTDERAGADCAALVVYGRRRMGERVRYVAPGGLLPYVEPIGDGPVQRGDVLHFGFQTAVLSEDRPPLGTLDAFDLVIHTYHGVAEEVPFGTLPYRGARVELLRWKP
jgi:hypothetical protein